MFLKVDLLTFKNELNYLQKLYKYSIKWEFPFWLKFANDIPIPNGKIPAQFPFEYNPVYLRSIKNY